MSTVFIVVAPEEVEAARVSPVRTSAGWALEVVDGRNDTGYSTSMVIDRFGHNHIAYAQYDDYTVYYATDSSGTWKIESLNDLVDVEQEISLAVDADGHAHVLYMRYYDEFENLTYATNAGGSWESTVIGSKVSGMYNDILIDKSGVIHIAYTLSDDSWNNNVLMYANNSGGTWNTPVLVDENGEEVGWHCSLAVTDLGHIYIVYQVRSGTDRFLRLAQKAPSMDWSPASLDFTVGTDELGYYASIASFGAELHVSHYDYGSYDLIYKHFDGVAWGDSEVVDSDGEVGEFSSIGVDSKGVPHIAYYDSSNGVLKMAEKAGTEWDVMVVDGESTTGNYCSLAISPDDRVRISYHADQNYDLCLASEDVWTTETVQSGNGLGRPSSMVLDDDGNAYIAYGDLLAKDLWFATNADGSWVTELVDSEGDVGSRLSLDIDGDRNAHISYLDRTNYSTGYIKYATNAGGSWNIVKIAQVDSDAPQANSLKVDSAGKIHIFFHNMTDGAMDLWYATNAGGSWDVSLFEACDLDMYYGVGGDNSLFIDTGDNLHVVYKRSFRHGSNYRNDVIYANNVGGTWSYEIAASGSRFGQEASLAVDLNGKAHIAFRDGTNYSLVYATNAGGSWANNTLATGTGFYASLATDSQGKVHIGFLNSTEETLRYMTNADGNWAYTTVTTVSDTSQDIRCSLVLDSGDKAHISYYDSTSGEQGLKYSTNSAWKLATLYDGPATFAPGQSSIKVDRNGWTHVCYYVTKNTSLMYANNVGGTWTYELVDGAGTVQAGGHCSMALDSNGKAHISYRDSLNGKLKYANNTGRDWTNVTLDGHVSVSYATSIAVDGDGKAYISYYASGSKDLKCATNKGGSWAYCVVDDSANDAGTYSSIAIQGILRTYRPHISYYDATTGDLKYAEFTGSTWATASWTITSIYASAADAGKYNSLALDRGGNAFVSFFDDTYDNLMLASNADGHWDYKTVDDTAGMYTSLARSASGALYIAYYDDVNDDLKLAVNLNGGYPTDGGWGIATVDRLGDVGKNPSICIGTQNVVHISYVDDSRDALKHAQMLAEPSAPLALTAVATLNDVALSWSAPRLDNGMAVTGYVLERTTEADATVDLIEVGNALTYSDNDLESGNFSYRVAAMNAVGTSAYSTKADVTVNTEDTSLPGAPKDLDADAGNGTVTLTWGAPDDDGGSPITGYMVYRGTSPSNLTLLDTIGSVTTYVDDTVVNNQTYHYKVSAVNVLGEGPATDVEDAMPTAEGGNDDEEGGSNTMLYIVIAVAVIAAVAAVAFLFLRKK